MPGGQGLRFSPRDDLLRERTDQAGDVADRLIGDVSRAERRDKMTGCQIEVFLTYPAAPVCLPHGRTGIRVGGAASSRAVPAPRRVLHHHVHGEGEDTGPGRGCR